MDKEKGYSKKSKEKQKKVICHLCGRELCGEGVICICEVTPKYDDDYVAWRDK